MVAAVGPLAKNRDSTNHRQLVKSPAFASYRKITFTKLNALQSKGLQLPWSFEQVFACIGAKPGSQIDAPTPDVLKLFGIRFHLFAPKLAFVTTECLSKGGAVSLRVGHAHGQVTSLDQRKGLHPMPR
jgi:hypothetical protein